MRRFWQGTLAFVFTALFTLWSVLALGEVWRFENVFQQCVLVSVTQTYYPKAEAAQK